MERREDKVEADNVGMSKPSDENMYTEWNSLLSNAQAIPIVYKTRFLVRVGRTFVTVFADEIVYFVTENGKTLAVTENTKRYMLDETLDELGSGLNPKDFFRLNRQFIAHIHSVDKVRRCCHGELKVKLKPPFKCEIVVSREKEAALKQWLGC